MNMAAIESSRSLMQGAPTAPAAKAQRQAEQKVAEVAHHNFEDCMQYFIYGSCALYNCKLTHRKYFEPYLEIQRFLNTKIYQDGPSMCTNYFLAQKCFRCSGKHQGPTWDLVFNDPTIQAIPFEEIVKFSTNIKKLPFKKL